MDIQAKVRSELTASSLGSEKRQLLHFILGELTNAPKCQCDATTLRRLLSENEKSKRQTRHPKELERIDIENNLIRMLL